MSFYRIYRPQVIEEIDNVAVREQLLSLLTKEKKQLPHAFLFTGPRGAGKTTAARIVAKLFNCTKPTKHGPCGKCDQCVTIADGRNLDVLEIDAASNRGIDEIRQLRDAINLSPSGAAYKFYIIDEVHMLTTEAFNALLKTLEEPPAHAVFVLATTDPQKVPATIKSRCVSISFHKASAVELAAALKRIVTLEKIPIDTAALTLLAASVDGSFRDAVKLLEQVSFHKGKINAEVVRNLISLSDESVITKFFESLAKKDARVLLSMIEDLVAQGKDIKIFLVDCLRRLQTELLNGNSDSKELIRRFTDAYALMKVSPIAELPLELVIVEYCSDVPAKAAGRAEGSESQGSIKKDSSTEFTPRPPSGLGMTEKPMSLGLLTLEKLTEHWKDFIEELKPFNHSMAGVLRSARPKEVSRGIVTIEAFYPFHRDKLSESKTKDVLIQVLKKLFGEKVKVEIVLGKK
ncbi:MAG: DNA polymerase III subunit gamma/tau [Candidatus Gottesmanbacteria bacterium]|nr:DNA polymerase III subunit gamma/tau [Candidatus Gottesmanbacteria bacterium]